MQLFFVYSRSNVLIFAREEVPNKNKNIIFIFLDIKLTSLRITSRSSCKRSTSFETPIGPLSKIISCNALVQLVRSEVRKRIAERRTLKSVSYDELSDDGRS
jgi:hypothetical protein